jgi:DNA (cytosine-5)-methyltransferase 1
MKYIDLFCGIGGFRLAAETVCREAGIAARCVFSSDIDPDAQKSYAANFGERPFRDITKIRECDIPDHDILFAGFPCQAFSICGDQLGFEDARGTLFFDIARILQAKRPRAFVLENVKQLRSHNQGQTLYRIMETLRNIGYHADYRILNALDFGLPQKRERIFIVGFLESLTHVTHRFKENLATSLREQTA